MRIPKKIIITSDLLFYFYSAKGDTVSTYIRKTTPKVPLFSQYGEKTVAIYGQMKKDTVQEAVTGTSIADNYRVGALLEEGGKQHTLYETQGKQKNHTAVRPAIGDSCNFSPNKIRK